ncbi:MAG: hypothetical protein WCI04_04250 [archaeon]
MKKIIVVLSLLFVLTILFGCTDSPTACTQEAKLCPDGTVVGRTLPNCEFAKCPRIDSNSNILVDKNQASFIEKRFFVDVFANYNVTLNVFWEKGSAKFIVTDPDGLEISKDNFDKLEKYKNGEWIDDAEDSLMARVYNPVSGYWKIRATELKSDFNDFLIQQSGTGESNMFFNLTSDKGIIYDLSENPLILGYLHGPVSGVKGIDINGTVLHQDSGEMQEFKLFDDGLAQHGDEYPNDGRYSNYLDWFGGEGNYRITMVANNRDGNGMSVVDFMTTQCPPDYNCNYPHSEKVAPFTRKQTITIYASDQNQTKCNVDANCAFFDTKFSKDNPCSGWNGGEYENYKCINKDIATIKTKIISDQIMVAGGFPMCGRAEYPQPPVDKVYECKCISKVCTKISKTG